MPSRKPRKDTIRRIVALARPERGRLAWGLVALAVGSSVSLVYPQGIRLVLDTAGGQPPAWAAGASSTEILGLIGLAMAGAALVSAAAMGIRFHLFNLAGERTVARLRARLYRAILAQEIAFFDASRTGELTSRLSADTGTLQSAVSANLSMALRNGVQLIGGVVMLIVTSPKLAALMLLVVPVIAVGAVVHGRRVRKLARAVQDAVAHSTAVAEESIAGVRTVRAFAAETREAARYDAANDRALGAARRRIRAASWFMAITSGSAYLAAATVFYAGGRMVAAHELTTGALASFLMYTLIVGFSLGAVADLWADMLRALGAAERVFDLIDRAPAMPLGGGDVLERVEGAVALEHVRFAYPTRPELVVLGDVSLALAPGEVVALVGPSGAGKSTVASLLCRFYDPQGGVVRLDGRDVRELDPTWLRQKIGVVAQEPVLFSTSVAENIRYGRPDATQADVEAAARTANADGFVRGFPDGYATLVGERGVQLSGGQKQRVAIARAVLKDPRLLILDEATSALDAESEHLVKEALERLMRGRTTLVIAHRLSTVKRADRIVVLEGGRIVEQGRHDVLVAAGGLYRKLVERQVAGLE
jgi:ATP-binding cassette subfamily B protein